jgi:Bacterial SH3 domain
MWKPNRAIIFALCAIALLACACRRKSSQSPEADALNKAGKNLHSVAVVLVDEAPLFKMEVSGLVQKKAATLGDSLWVLDPAKDYQGKKPSEKRYALVRDSSDEEGWIERSMIAPDATAAVVYGEGAGYINNGTHLGVLSQPILVAIPEKAGATKLFSVYDEPHKRRLDNCVLSSGEISMKTDDVSAVALFTRALRIGDDEEKARLFYTIRTAYPDSVVIPYVNALSLETDGPMAGEPNAEELSCVFSVCSDEAALMSEPSADSERLATIPNGTDVEVSSRSILAVEVNGSMGRWYHVSYGDSDGWVFGANLEGADDDITGGK